MKWASIRRLFLILYYEMKKRRHNVVSRVEYRRWGLRLVWEFVFLLKVSTNTGSERHEKNFIRGNKVIGKSLYSKNSNTFF